MLIYFLAVADRYLQGILQVNVQVFSELVQKKDSEKDMPGYALACPLRSSWWITLCLFCTRESSNNYL